MLYANDIEKLISAISSYGSQQAFPRINVRKITDLDYLIEFAVAGYHKESLKVTIEGNTLIVSSPGQDEASNFITRGFTYKAFERTLTLSPQVIVSSAELVDGVLKVLISQSAKTGSYDLPINVPQPAAKEHPTLLNEDASI